MLLWGALLPTLLMLTFVTIVGYRLTSFLPATLQGSARVYLSPVFGLAILVLIATIHGWIAPFKQSTTLGITVGLLLVSLWFERSNKFLVTTLAVTLLIGLTTLIVHFSPLFKFGIYNWFNDAFTYLVHGQWLQQHSYAEPATPSGNHPAWTQVTIYQTQGSRMGASFVLGWVQALFGLEWSYYSYPVVMGLALACAALAVAGGVLLFTPENLKYRNWIAALIACAVANTANGLQFGTVNGFLPQTFGLAFAVTTVILFASLLDDASKQPANVWRTARHVAPLAITFAAMVYCYNEILGLAVGGAGLFGLVLIAFRLVPIRSIIVVTATALCEALILVASEIPRLIKYLNGVVFGLVSYRNAYGVLMNF
jgi:hypothetical protein